MTSSCSAERTWRVANPLPKALHHYALALTDTLAEAGVRTRSVPVRSSELGQVRGWTRARSGLGLLAERPARSESGEPTIVIWPALGLWDPLRLTKAGSVLVVHDPRPLRHALGYGQLARRLGRPSRRGPVIVVHSTTAAEDLLEMGWPAPWVLPHPMRRPAEDAPLVREDSVCVLGSAKPTRDLAALRLLAEARPTERLSLLGRGWEDLSGWDVEDRHLSEAEFDRSLAVAGCVVIPYVRFYSSGVAVRALEQLAPVVGPRHPQLEQLLGVDWPGLVEHRADWPAAVRRACAVAADDIAGRRDAYFARCRTEWAAFAATAGNGVAA